MNRAKSIMTMAIVLGAFITTVSTAVYASSYDKMNGSDLYGLPHVIGVHDNINTAQLDFGADGYGLPDVSNRHDMKNDFAKIDFGGDLYGLPFVGKFHK